MSRLAALAVAALLMASALTPLAVAGPTTTSSLADSDESPRLDDTHPSTSEASSTDAIAASSLAMPLSTDREPMLTTPNNTTRRLALTGAQVGNYSTVHLDFGGTMALSAERVRSQYQVSLVDVQLQQVQSQDARTAVVNAYLDAVLAEVDRINAAETDAVARYRTGEIDAETLLVQLAVIDMRARAIEDALGQVERSSEPLPRSALSRIESVRLELEGFETRVRRHVATAATGDLKGGVNPLHVAASTDGVVVEMLDDRRYYRNTVRFDNRDVGAVDQFGGVEEFQNRVDELYPWSYDARRGITIDTSLARNVYQATYSHPQGALTVFVDGGTREVFREQQSLILGRLPQPDVEQAMRDNVTVTVSPTPKGGPVLVNVTAPTGVNATAEPADGVVRVNGETLGRTGSDGELWVLAPLGDYEVSVTTGGTTVNVSVPNTAANSQSSVDAASASESPSTTTKATAEVDSSDANRLGTLGRDAVLPHGVA